MHVVGRFRAKIYAFVLLMETTALHVLHLEVVRNVGKGRLIEQIRTLRKERIQNFPIQFLFDSSHARILWYLQLFHQMNGIAKYLQNKK